MRLQEFIRRLQEIEREHGNLLVEARNEAGDRDEARKVSVQKDGNQWLWVVIEP